MRAFRAVGAAVILAVAGITAAAGHPVPVTGTPVAVAPAFPYPHMSIRTAQEANAPDGTLFVTVDDGSARPRMSNGQAVPVNGTLSKGPAFDDPTRCARVHGQTEVCWRYWQVVGDEVRVWTTYADRSCVVIGTTTGDPTRVMCDGITVKPR